MLSLDKLNLKSKKYIIFDMDGTLIDSIGVWNRIDQKLIEEYAGITVDLDFIQSERDAFLHSNQDSDIYVAYCDYLINKYHFSIQNAEELLKIRWNKSGEILETEMDFKSDVPKLILRLKSLGFTLVLATMTTQVQLDIYSRKNKKMLEQIDISQVFDLITIKEDVKNKKPDPEIYNKIMQHYGANPDECLIFEDSYTGVLASKNAGIEVINIYDKYADLDRDKINLITDYSITNYRQFIDYLERTYINPEEVKGRSEFNMSKDKVTEFAKNLTKNIENGTFQRKISSTTIDYYDSQVEELCLYKYKRYLGSLRCLLDTQNMRQVIKPGGVKDTPNVKCLVKKQ